MLPFPRRPLLWHPNLPQHDDRWWRWGLGVGAGCRTMCPTGQLNAISMNCLSKALNRCPRCAGGKPLEGKVAVVTGATRGIGAAIAKALGGAGATVIGTATSDSGAEAISAALAAEGIAGEGMTLNVTDADAIAAAVKDIGAKFGVPTIVVNNAGAEETTGAGGFADHHRWV